VDEVVVLFKARVIFKQYIPDKHKHLQTLQHNQLYIWEGTGKMQHK
jgi:hypothetical protein